MKDLEAPITSLCDTLIDAVCERGECDFVWDLAAPLPMAVIGDMLGVRPEEREMFLKWSDDLVSALELAPRPKRMSRSPMDAFAAYSGYMMGMIEARKPSRPTIWSASWCTPRSKDQRLEDHQIVTEVLLLLIGGDETTRHTLSGGTSSCCCTPISIGRLADDLSLLPNAIEEMLRWTVAGEEHGPHDHRRHRVPRHRSCTRARRSSCCSSRRTSTRRCSSDPESFDIERYPNNHLAFGFGTHFCLGNQLARLELSIMQTAAAQRLPDLRLAADADVPLRPANFVSGLEKMPVVFTPSAPWSRA